MIQKIKDYLLLRKYRKVEFIQWEIQKMLDSKPGHLPFKYYTGESTRYHELLKVFELREKRRFKK